MSTAASQTDHDKQAFWQQLQSFVGKEIGPPQPAPDEVNIPMIRHWCEAIGDNNPIYLDSTAAAASIHQQIVAPHHAASLGHGRHQTACNQRNQPIRRNEPITFLAQLHQRRCH